MRAQNLLNKIEINTPFSPQFPLNTIYESNSLWNYQYRLAISSFHYKPIIIIYVKSFTEADSSLCSQVVYCRRWTSILPDKQKKTVLMADMNRRLGVAISASEKCSKKEKNVQQLNGRRAYWGVMKSFPSSAGINQLSQWNIIYSLSHLSRWYIISNKTVRTSKFWGDIVFCVNLTVAYRPY